MTSILLTGNPATRPQATMPKATRPQTTRPEATTNNQATGNLPTGSNQRLRKQQTVTRMTKIRIEASHDFFEGASPRLPAGIAVRMTARIRVGF